MAEDERNRIRKRQREGIDVALKNGVAFGRLKSIIMEEFKKAYHRWNLGEMTVVKAMQEISVKKIIFYRLVKEYEKNQKMSRFNRRNSSKKSFLYVGNSMEIVSG